MNRIANAVRNTNDSCTEYTLNRGCPADRSAKATGINSLAFQFTFRLSRWSEALKFRLYRGVCDIVLADSSWD